MIYRTPFSDSLLADLYDFLAMPPHLAKAHSKLDRAIDRLYVKIPFTSDADLVALLLEKYQEATR